MDDFRQGMRQLAGAVTIITTGRGQDVAGLTATAVCSLTAEPPRLLACLNTGGGSFDVLRRHNRFCVNLIGAPDLEIARIFAGMGTDRTADKFASGAWVHAEDRAPRLTSALVAFECAVHSLTLLSTHCLAVGDVLDVHLADPTPAPLLYHDGRFAELAVAPVPQA